MSPITLRRFMERQTREPRQRDPYRRDSKPVAGFQCSSCGAISVRGRWTPRNTAKDEDLEKISGATGLCPACRQLKEKYAEGILELHGLSWREKADEILRTLRDTE